MRQDSDMTFQIFLCHASSDKKTVRDLYYRLSTEGIDVWIDENNLLPGQDWKLEIPKAIRNSSVVIVCLSKNSITKEGYVQKEIKIALDAADEKPEGTIYIIPVKLEECEVPQRLKGRQWVNLFEENGYDKLIASFKMRAEDLGLDSNFFKSLDKDVRLLTAHINKIRSETMDDSSPWANSQ